MNSVKLVIAFSLLLATLCSCGEQSITPLEPTPSSNPVVASTTPALLGNNSQTGLSQVKYSFDEVSYGPREKTKAITVYTSNIKDDQGNPKYKITATIDIENNKVLGNTIFVYESGKPGVICLTTVTHVSHLYLGTPNTGGVEAYACQSKFSNMVFYFLAGATTPNTLKFLLYIPSGPTDFKTSN